MLQCCKIFSGLFAVTEHILGSLQIRWYLDHMLFISCLFLTLHGQFLHIVKVSFRTSGFILTLCFSIMSEGFVVANDCDNKRCYLMVHQVRRLASSNFLVMNMDASRVPAFVLQVRK